MAAVAWFLISAGPFRTIAMAAGAGDVEKCCALHLDICREARTALLTGFDRSIVETEGGGAEDASNGSTLHMILLSHNQSAVSSLPVGGAGGVVDCRCMNHSVRSRNIQKSFPSSGTGRAVWGKTFLSSLTQHRAGVGPISGQHWTSANGRMALRDWTNLGTPTPVGLSPPVSRG